MQKPEDEEHRAPITSITPGHRGDNKLGASYLGFFSGNEEPAPNGPINQPESSGPASTGQDYSSYKASDILSADFLATYRLLLPSPGNRHRSWSFPRWLATRIAGNSYIFAFWLGASHSSRVHDKERVITYIYFCRACRIPIDTIRSSELSTLELGQFSWTDTLLEVFLITHSALFFLPYAAFVMYHIKTAMQI